MNWNVKFRPDFELMKDTHISHWGKSDREISRIHCIVPDISADTRGYSIGPIPQLSITLYILNVSISRGRRAPSQYKDRLSRYGDSHYKDKTVSRTSYVYTGNSYTDETASFY